MRMKRVLYGSINRLAHFLTQTRWGRVIVFVSLPTAIVLLAMWEPDRNPPIFDTQVHYNKQSWRRVSIQAIMNTAREFNVPWMLVGSMPNEGTWRLYRAAPDIVIPMYIPHETRESRDTWFKDETYIEKIEKAIDSGEYRGIGEVFLFDGQVNTPVVRHMLKLAVEHDLVLHARSDPNALRQLFAMQPTIRILWAHAGMFTQPDTIRELLDEYPNLWVDISLRGDVAPGEKLDARWRDLMIRHHRRFMLGSGTYNNRYWYQFRYAMIRYREWLDDLPPEITEQIAYRNGLELFGVPEKNRFRDPD